MSRVSVVIVSYNTRDKLRKCLQAIDPEHEIIVVDNASADGSVEMVRKDFPAVHLIASDRNLGFGAANNLGVRSATGDRVLYLNSDAYAKPGAIAQLAQVLDDPGTVAAGGRLLNTDGTLQQSIAGRLTLCAVILEQTYLEVVARRFGRSYWKTPEMFSHAERSGQPVPVEQVMGACLMVRLVNGQPLEAFDERFFLYCEDTDLCFRLRRHGEIRYEPKAAFVHELGSSSARDPALGIIRYNRGKELYFRIHHGSAAALICWCLNRLGALLRLVVWAAISAVKPASRAKIGVFWRVLTARGPDPAALSRTLR